ncbi:MAG: CPBP family intramembrane metalloprotease [Acidimicrobiales bacterium]|nr:CPBP family intramembrane metalloprotease [Acidimicrobiales bacterium]
MPPRWGVKVAVVGFAVGLVLSTVTASIAGAATGFRAGSNAPVPIAVTAADVAGLWVGLVGAAVYASRTRGRGSLAADFGYRIGAWWDLLAGALVGLACQYGLVPLIYLPFEHLDRNLSHQIGRPAQRDTAAAHTSAALTVLIIFLAVGAPLVEELFFRGLLLRSLAGWMSTPIAIVVTGLLFALAHFEAVQFAGLAVFGVVLGLLAWVTGRLGPSIGAHMAFNAVAVIGTAHVH